MSEEGKDLIKKMLVVDPETRINGIEALHHPWFKKHENMEKDCEDDKLDPDVIDSLLHYRGVSSLKKAALNMLVKMLDTRELENLREEFLKIDKDGTGLITV